MPDSKNQTDSNVFLVLALPTPLNRTFDYLPPENYSTELPMGIRVRVSFGRQELIGVLIDIRGSTDVPTAKLKRATEILDKAPVLRSDLLTLAHWASQYYHHPIGEVIGAMLPTALRRGDSSLPEPQKAWRLTIDEYDFTSKRAPRQQEILEYFHSARRKGQLTIPNEDFRAQAFSAAAIKALRHKGAIEPCFVPYSPPSRSTSVLAEEPLSLNDEQQLAINDIEDQRFKAYLLDGATGSGKTEVYLQAISRCLEKGLQALILIPEIGLTPQTVDRFRRRFHRPIAVIHSGLNDNERKNAWLSASRGDVDIVIGTRSAIFTPLPQPGIIILDEEHDLSFKQQDSFRYSARELALIRARDLNIPLLLGSATPSLETLWNCQNKRYHHLILTQRAGTASQPDVELIDLQQFPATEGIAEPVLVELESCLRRGEQALVFINRRGYAPTLMCRQCAWIWQCPHCDARLTMHTRPRHLHCHHCDYREPLPRQCGRCQSEQLEPVGQGTERAEAFLRDHFSQFPVLRVDSNSMSRKDAMQQLVKQINHGDATVLVGTQMLAKGHHFPKVTCVAIIDADSGLFSTDFRGPERLAQLLVQVAGRAGRSDRKGKVLIQTHFPEHPLFSTLLNEGYSSFATKELETRRASDTPPFCYLALLRAESGDHGKAARFLSMARQIGESLLPCNQRVSFLGPLPAPMEKRNGRYRYQLQFASPHRAALHRLLDQLLHQLYQQAPNSRDLRWSIDIEPQDMS